MRYMRALLIIAGLFITGFVQPASASRIKGTVSNSSYLLQNQKIRATFDRAGLQIINDKILNKSYAFSGDSFSITIDGRPLDKESLTLKGIRHKGHELVYTFSSSDYTIQEVYSVKPGWRFVGKQLFVTANNGKKTFRIN
ncbi:MAG TPA: hypothetical protein VJ991_05445, partial [Balneolales bacterium]|nr:hypothetical protein [Balneolales bacterium]